MSWQSARYARGSDIHLKGHNHPKWDILGGFSRELLMQRCRATDDEIADCGLQIEKGKCCLDNPQSPIRNFRGVAY